MVKVEEGRLGVRQRRFLGGINQPADVLQDGRRVLGVFEREGKRGPRGDGTWFLFGSDIGLVIFVCGGGVTFAQLHLDSVQDTGPNGVVVIGERKGMAACKCAACRAGGDKGWLDFFLVVVCFGGAVLGRRGVGLGDGTTGALS